MNILDLKEQMEPVLEKRDIGISFIDARKKLRSMERKGFIELPYNPVLFPYYLLATGLSGYVKSLRILNHWLWSWPNLCKDCANMAIDQTKKCRTCCEYKGDTWG